MSNKGSWLVTGFTTGIFLLLVTVEAFAPEYVTLTDQLIQALIFMTGGTWTAGVVNAGRKRYLEYKEKCMKKSENSDKT